MTTTPRGAPELVSAQATPETTVNEQIRRTEAGAGRYPVADRVTAPPGSCADGATYLIIATATGAFAGKENQLATAVGTNAASGWYYRTMGTLDEGILAYVQDEDAEYKWSGAAWATYGGSGYAPGGTDVALADGGTGASLTDPNADRILFWDDSAGAVTWLTAGTGLTITGTTIDAAAGSGYTDEQAQDAIGAMIDGSLTYVDGTPLLQVTRSALKPTEHIQIACSDETTAITTGTAKVTFRMPYAFTVTDVRASVNTAPTGSTILIDINEGGTTILSTKLMIDASEKTSTTAATPAVISDTSLADDAEMTIDFDQVGSTIAGKGVKVILIGYRT
jgi:hypothetical protein